MRYLPLVAVSCAVLSVADCSFDTDSLKGTGFDAGAIAEAGSANDTAVGNAVDMGIAAGGAGPASGGMAGANSGGVAGAATGGALGCAAVSNISGWWDADAVVGAKAKDLSGHLHDGDLKGNISIVPGIVGNAFLFDGKTAEIEIPNAPEFNATTAISIEVWVRPSGQGDAWRVVGKQKDGSNASSYALGIHHGKLFFNIFNNDMGITQTATSGGEIPVDAWSHIAAVWDRTAIRLYVNGVALVSSANIASGYTATDYPLRIGKGDTDFYAFAGLIDEVSFYDRVLSPAEVALIVKAASRGKCKPSR